MKTHIPVQCNECGRRFRASGFDPKCPKCGGVDIEPDYDFAILAIRKPKAKVQA